MAFNGTEGGAIPLADASAMTNEYRLRNPNQRLAHFFGRNILQEILAQENCVGIRIYYGLNQNAEQELILVGADSDENDILHLVADISTPCPKACSSLNALNS